MAKKDKGFYPDLHVEKHNPVMEYSKSSPGDYLDPKEELAEMMMDAHAKYYVEGSGIAKGLPSTKLGQQESIVARGD